MDSTNVVLQSHLAELKPRTIVLSIHLTGEKKTNACTEHIFSYVDKPNRVDSITWFAYNCAWPVYIETQYKRSRCKSNFSLDFPYDESDWSTSFDSISFFSAQLWSCTSASSTPRFTHYIRFLFFALHVSQHRISTLCTMYSLLMLWWFTKEIANFLAIRHRWQTCALMMHIPIECVLEQPNHRQR